jgi:uncharacterized protein with HEPN domain
LKGDREHLVHIELSIARINEIQREGRKRFLREWRSQSAVLHELQTLAESTQRLSNDIKARHPDIQWKQVAGLRNVVAHEYLNVSLDRIWATLVENLPQLEAAVTSELAPKQQAVRKRRSEPID